MKNQKNFSTKNGIAAISTIEKSDFHLTQEVKIFFILSGDLELIQNGQLILLKSGDIYLVNKGEVVGLMGGKENLVLTVRLTIDYLEKKHLKFSLKKPVSLIYDKETYDMLAQHLVNLFIEGTQKRHGYEYIVDGYVQQLIGVLIRHIPQVNVQNSKLANIISQKNIEIIDYINEHFTEKISLTSLSEHFFISKYYLAHSFKEELGITVGNYIKEIRLLNSLKMLETTAMSITEIALQNGFSSLRSYSDAFRQRNDLLPVEYREKYKLAAVSFEEVNMQQLKVLELLSHDIFKEDLSAFDKNRTQVIDKVIYMDKVVQSQKKSDLILKIKPENMENNLKPALHSLGVKYVSIRDLMTKINSVSEEGICLVFDPVYKELIQVTENGGIPYIQIDALDYDMFLAKGIQEEISFYDLLRQFTYFLQSHFSSLKEWRIEFRCFYEYANKGKLCQPVKETIFLFKDICQLVIHFPKHPFEVATQLESSDERVYSIDDETILREISFSSAIENLSQQKYIETIAQNANIKLQSIILEQISSLESDEYLKKNRYLILANQVIWHFFNELRFNRQNLIPLSLDATQLFTYFPEELSEKMAVMDKDGLIRDSWYSYQFINLLYDEIVFKNEFCILTKYQENYRILSVYPEKEMTDLFNVTNKQVDKVSQKPYVSLKLELIGITGKYTFIQEELTKDIRTDQDNLARIDKTVKLSPEDVVYLNSMHQPARTMKTIECSSTYFLEINVPLFGIVFTEFKKIK